MAEKIHTIILVKRPFHAIARMVLAYAFLCAFVAFGVYVGSTALQWIFSIIFFAGVIVKANSRIKTAMTPDEAIAEIQRIKESGQ